MNVPARVLLLGPMVGRKAFPSPTDNGQGQCFQILEAITSLTLGRSTVEQHMERLRRSALAGLAGGAGD